MTLMNGFIAAAYFYHACLKLYYAPVRVHFQYAVFLFLFACK